MYPSRMRPATSTDGTSGCRASALIAIAREPDSAASIAARSAARTERMRPWACSGTLPIAAGTIASPADDAGDLDDRLLVEERQARTVGDVEDHDPVAVAIEAVHEVEGEGSVVPRPTRLDDLGHGLLAPGPRLLHVVRLALGMGSTPVAERLGRGAVTGVEGRLLPLEERGANSPGPHRLERLGVEVVVVEVLVRDHVHRAQPLGAEQAALLERLEPIRVGEEPGEQVPPPVEGPAEPAEVVDPEVVEPQVVDGVVQRARDPLAQVQRRVADPDHPVSEDSPDGLGHQSHRVREVHEGRVGRSSGDDLGDRGDDRHGPQRERDATGAGGLLSDDALGDGRGLVEDPARHPTGTNGAVDDVRAIDGRLEVRGHGHRGPDAELLGDAIEDATDPVEPALIDVVEGDLVVLRRDVSGREGPIDHRRPEPSGADQG